MFASHIGSSVSGRFITALSNFDPARELPGDASLLVGGIHGDEPATVYLLESFWRNYGHQLERPFSVVSLANPDGFNLNSRYNARGVDLNRNFGHNWDPKSEEPSGAHPWSEPETCALRDFILRLKPARVVSLHWALAEIDADGPQSTPLARAMWDALDETERAPYRLRAGLRLGSQAGIQGDEPQATAPQEPASDLCPGSLGQWCGYGLSLEGGVGPAMITLELPFDPDARERPAVLAANHVQQMRDLWRREPKAYLEKVQGAIHRMLLVACGAEG